MINGTYFELGKNVSLSSEGILLLPNSIVTQGIFAT